MFEKNFVITDKNAEEYVGKIGGFIRERVNAAARKGIVLGMSGGLDSAVAARLCQAAGVPVLPVMLPDGKSMETSKSMEHAVLLMDKFGFEYKVINIGKACAEIEKAAGEACHGDGIHADGNKQVVAAPDKGTLSDISKINIRPRVRMTVLYSLAQTMQRFVMGTGNLSERLLGYFTKWGDGASDLNPLGLLVKGEVRILARALGVPREIIDKAPSADLYEGQTDESDLGISYAEIDAYALTGTSGSAKADGKIKARIGMSLHKNNPVPIFAG